MATNVTALVQPRLLLIALFLATLATSNAEASESQKKRVKVPTVRVTVGPWKVLMKPKWIGGPDGEIDYTLLVTGDKNEELFFELDCEGDYPMQVRLRTNRTTVFSIDQILNRWKSKGKITISRCKSEFVYLSLHKEPVPGPPHLWKGDYPFVVSTSTNSLPAGPHNPYLEIRSDGQLIYGDRGNLGPDPYKAVKKGKEWWQWPDGKLLKFEGWKPIFTKSAKVNLGLPKMPI